MSGDDDVVMMEVERSLSDFIADENVVRVERWLHRLACRWKGFLDIFIHVHRTCHARSGNYRIEILTRANDEITDVLEEAVDRTAYTDHVADPRHYFGQTHRRFVFSIYSLIKFLFKTLQNFLSSISVQSERFSNKFRYKVLLFDQNLLLALLNPLPCFRLKEFTVLQIS